MPPLHPHAIPANTLFYGDNLTILREHIASESVDMVYLDPPFNSNRNYNVLFKDESGKESESQITAFEDTWHWGADAEQTYHELVMEGPERVGAMIGALRSFIGTNQMLAYLVIKRFRCRRRTGRSSRRSGRCRQPASNTGSTLSRPVRGSVGDYRG